MGSVLPAKMVMGQGGPKFSEEKLTGDVNFSVLRMHMKNFIRLHYVNGYLHLSDHDPLDVTLFQNSDKAALLSYQLMYSMTV